MRVLLGPRTAGRTEDYAIAALGFGGIQSIVGDSEQRLDSCVSIGWIEYGRTHTTVECELGTASADLQVGDRVLEADQSLLDSLARNLGQGQQELLAAVPAGMVIGADGGSDRRGEPAQRLIAGQVSIAIIDALEVVQINQRHNDGTVLPQSAVCLRR